MTPDNQVNPARVGKMQSRINTLNQEEIATLVYQLIEDYEQQILQIRTVDLVRDIAAREAAIL